MEALIFAFTTNNIPGSASGEVAASVIHYLSVAVLSSLRSRGSGMYGGFSPDIFIPWRRRTDICIILIFGKFS